jgi:hypothetical protein
VARMSTVWLSPWFPSRITTTRASLPHQLPLTHPCPVLGGERLPQLTGPAAQSLNAFRMALEVHLPGLNPSFTGLWFHTLVSGYVEGMVTKGCGDVNRELKGREAAPLTGYPSTGVEGLW